jgi:hypothetical protein
MMRWVCTPKEEHDAMRKMTGRIRQSVEQEDNGGLPSIAALIPPADGGELPEEFTRTNSGLWVPDELG